MNNPVIPPRARDEAAHFTCHVAVTGGAPPATFGCTVLVLLAAALLGRHPEMFLHQNRVRYELRIAHLTVCEEGRHIRLGLEEGVLAVQLPDL